MATNESLKSGQDLVFDSEPTTGLPSQQQQLENVIPDSTVDITSPERQSAIIENDSQIWIHNPSNYPDSPLGNKPELNVPDDQSSQSDLKKLKQELEMVFHHNRYADKTSIGEMSSIFNVSKKAIADWFENKRSEVENKKQQAEQQYNQVLTIQKQQYSQQLLAYRHHKLSQSPFMFQASSSMNYAGQQPVGHVQYSNSQQQPTGQYCTPQQQPVGQYFTSQQQPMGQYCTPQQQPVGRYSTSQQQPMGQYYTPQRQPVGQYSTPQQKPVGQYSTPQQQPVGRYSTPQQQPVGRYSTPQQQPAGQCSTPQQQPAGQCSTPQQQQPAGLTSQHFIYLENLFTAGERYPDTSELAMKLNVSQPHLDVWFAQRRDVWKKDLAKQAYNRMWAAQQHS